MTYGYYQPYWLNDDELEHFGIKGMKWGIRRYQNPDGTLTDLGKQRYGSAENLQADRQRKKEVAIKAAKVAAGVAATGLAVAGASVGFKLVESAAFKVAMSEINSGKAVNVGAKTILAISPTLKNVKESAISSLNKTLNIQKHTTTGFKKTPATERVQKQLEEAYRKYLLEERKKALSNAPGPAIGWRGASV